MPSYAARCAHVDTARHLSRLVDKATREEAWTAAERADALLLLNLFLHHATVEERGLAKAAARAAAGITPRGRSD